MPKEKSSQEESSEKGSTLARIASIGLLALVGANVLSSFIKKHY